MRKLRAGRLNNLHNVRQLISGKPGFRSLSAPCRVLCTPAEVGAFLVAGLSCWLSWENLGHAALKGSCLALAWCSVSRLTVQPAGSAATMRGSSCVTTRGVEGLADAFTWETVLLHREELPKESRDSGRWRLSSLTLYQFLSFPELQFSSVTLEAFTSCVGWPF